MLLDLGKSRSWMLPVVSLPLELVLDDREKDPSQYQMNQKNNLRLLIM